MVVAVMTKDTSRGDYIPDSGVDARVDGLLGDGYGFLGNLVYDRHINPLPPSEIAAMTDPFGLILSSDFPLGQISQDTLADALGRYGKERLAIAVGYGPKGQPFSDDRVWGLNGSGGCLGLYAKEAA